MKRDHLASKCHRPLLSIASNETVHDERLVFKPSRYWCSVPLDTSVHTH